MEELQIDNYISKKELLEKYGISYGALYRWKRRGLIPDEWFMRRSAVTGQETYFPRKLICDRINYILTGKSSQSLDELAEELKSDENDRFTVIIETKYGINEYDLSDIKSIRVRGGGKEIDLASMIGKEKNE